MVMNCLMTRNNVDCYAGLVGTDGGPAVRWPGFSGMVWPFQPGTERCECSTGPGKVSHVRADQETLLQLMGIESCSQLIWEWRFSSCHSLRLVFSLGLWKAHCYESKRFAETPNVWACIKTNAQDMKIYAIMWQQMLLLGTLMAKTFR